MKIFRSCLVVLLAFVAVALFAHYMKSPAGFGLAMMIPVMPKIMGRRLLNRAPLDDMSMSLNSGTWGLGGEDLSYPVYDRVLMDSTIAAGVERTMFNQAVGTDREGVKLTYADTNIEAPNVPNSQKFGFKKLQMIYMASAVRDQAGYQLILDYVRQCTVRFNIDSKADMFRLPLWKFAGTLQVVTAPAATINTTVPMPFWTGIWEIDVPLVLQALTIFKLVLNPQAASNAALNGDKIGFIFDSGRLRKN